MKIIIVTENENIASHIQDIFVEKGRSADLMPVQIFDKNDDSFDFDAYEDLIYWGNMPEYVEKAFNMAKTHNYKNAILINHVFSYFERTYPERKLTEHPFISRLIECEKIVLEYCDDMRVSIIELPFVNGFLPKEFPVIDGSVGYKIGKIYFAPAGGAPEISERDAVKAIFSVYVNGKNGVIYPICEKCNKYKAILKQVSGEENKVFEYPVELSWIYINKINKKFKAEKVTPVFCLKKLYRETLQQNFFFDANAVRKELNYDELWGNE